MSNNLWFLLVGLAAVGLGLFLKIREELWTRERKFPPSNKWIEREFKITVWTLIILGVVLFLAGFVGTVLL